MRSLRILVADDHEVVRRGIKALLETQSGWEVIGEAADGKEAVEKAAELQPDLIVLDISLPQMEGLEAGSVIRQKYPQIEVLILTYHDSPFMVRKALDSGIHGFVLKSDAGRELLTAVSTVSEHQVFLSSKVSAEMPWARTPGAGA